MKRTEKPHLCFLVSLLITLSTILTFSSVSNAVYKHTPFSLNTTKIMVVTTTTYVNTTVIKAMIATLNNDYS